MTADEQAMDRTSQKTGVIMSGGGARAAYQVGVLKAVARSLARISDDRCHVARHGGEEFVILFRGQSLDQAWQTLDTAREHAARAKEALAALPANAYREALADLPDFVVERAY